MSARTPVLDVLLRVRRVERDRAAARRHATEQERRRADEVSALAHAAAAGSDAALQRAGEHGVIGAIWQVAAAGSGKLQLTAKAGDARLVAAAAQQDQARGDWVVAERALAGLERLAARRERAQRVRALRAAQRVIDDLALQGRGARRRTALLGLLLLSSLVVSTPSTSRAEIPAGGASLERLLSDIRMRSRELDQRENELSERERGVTELERAVDARLDELASVSNRIERRIADWEESHGAKSVSRLAKIYAEMSPPTAAELVEELDLDLATAVLAKMKPKKSAAILPLLSEPRALSISRFVGHPLGITPTPPEPEKR